jgi:tripartite-type tricarboxylate transporter receptor subunit TctC
MPAPVVLTGIDVFDRYIAKRWMTGTSLARFLETWFTFGETRGSRLARSIAWRFPTSQRRRIVKLFHWRFLHLAAAVAVAFSGIFFSAHRASSQTGRTIKVVVAAPAGGPGDTTIRLFAEQISQGFSRARGPMIEFEPRMAADGTLGAEFVSQAAPDGNTLLMTTNSFIINPYLRAVRYDPLTGFEPVCYLVSSPEVVVVNGTSNYRKLADLLNAAHAKPGELTMASFGPAGSAHIAVEMLKLAANVNMHYIAFSSQVSAVNALLGDHVTSAIVNYKGEADYLKAGTLRALATASRARLEALPAVPTVAESGYEDFESEIRLWLFAPAKTPKQTVSEIAGLFTAAMQVPEVKSKLVAQELYPVAMCGADFAAFVRKRYDEIGRVIREANIQ